MSERDLEMLRAGFAAYLSGDTEAATRRLADDFWIRDHVILEGNEYRGREGLLENTRLIEQVIEDARWEILDMRDLGDHVAVHVRLTGRGRESGVDVQREAGQLWHIRDGLAVGLEVFNSFDEALEAAGR